MPEVKRYSPKEIARLEGVHLDTVYTWIRVGVLIARRPAGVRGRIWVYLSDYEEFRMREAS